MITWFKDLRYGARSLLRQPTFTLVAVLTLALGIGTNTTIFSVINALILTPPEIVEPDRVVAVWQTPRESRREGYTSYLNLQDWRARNQSFEDIAGYKPIPFIVSNGDEVESVQGMRVTANFLTLLKVAPIRGRNFLPDEEKSGSQKVALISYNYWQSRFAGREDALNQQFLLDGASYTVIGILPNGFEFPLSFKNIPIWTTVAAENANLTERGAQVLRAFGRLKADVSLESAQADLQNIAAGLAQQYPNSNANFTTYLVGAHEQIVGKDVRRALWLLLGAVGFILLIACTNAANLLLVRASTREKEIAIRSALGASRWRIARTLFVESILLSFLAGGLGLFIAIWGIRIIEYYATNQLPRITEVAINSKVLIFTLGISFLTGLLFSLVPTLKTSRPDVNEVLKSSSRSATSGRSLRLWRNFLVVSEVALSLILLVGAGLMIKSLAQLINVPPGFDANNVLTGRITLTRDVYKNPEQCVLYVNQTLARLEQIPGVESAAFVAPMPFTGANVGSDFRIKGRPEPEPGTEPSASNRSVTPEYFTTMRIPLLKGRHFTSQDRIGQQGAAIVNESLVKAYFPGEDPLGQIITNIGANQNPGDPKQWQIVGVVADNHHNSLIKDASPEIFLPYQQNSWSWGSFLIRSTVAPGTLADSFRREIKAGDKTVAVTRVRPLTEMISETITQARFYTFLFGLFGAIGLVLTMTGVYSLISYTVAQRTQEIGIRMALGAGRQHVLKMVIGHAFVLALVGAGIGLVISFWLSRLIAELLFDVKPTDLFSFGFATLVLLVCALVASYLPARRATKVDPIIALRFD